MCGCGDCPRPDRSSSPATDRPARSHPRRPSWTPGWSWRRPPGPRPCGPPRPRRRELLYDAGLGAAIGLPDPGLAAATRDHGPRHCAGRAAAGPHRHRCRAGHRPAGLSHGAGVHPHRQTAPRPAPATPPRPRPAPPLLYRDLWLELRFADGQTASTHPRSWPRTFETEEPDPPFLYYHGSGGSERGWHSPHWLWGLPPPGPLAFMCQWPTDQNPSSRVEIDARLVLEAADRAVPVWPAG
jgi:hypothetical protein